MDFLGGRMWDRGKEGQLEVLKKSWTQTVNSGIT